MQLVCLCLRAITCNSVWMPGSSSLWLCPKSPSSKHSCHSWLCWNIGGIYNNIMTEKGCKIRHLVVLRTSNRAATMLCRLTSIVWQAAVTYISICLCQSVHCQFVFQFVFPPQTVTPPVRPSICVSACLSARLCVGMRVCSPRYPSLIAKCCMFIRLPCFGAHPGETLRRLIRGWAHVKLIASQRRSFWQWYWWMGR